MPIVKAKKNNNASDAKVPQMRPKRKRTSSEQLNLLIASFEKSSTPSNNMRELLAQRLNMTNREVQVWFQNRRAKVNRLRSKQRQENKKEPEQESKDIVFHYWDHKSDTASTASSSPQTPYEIVLGPNLTSLDILATAAAYVQQCKKEGQEYDQRKHWRPWL